MTKDTVEAPFPPLGGCPQGRGDKNIFLEQPRRGKSSVARGKARGTSAATPARVAIIVKGIKPNNMELIEELKTKMIEALNLEEMTPADIDDNAPLFGDEGLGLDSIDVLELIVLLERNYGIKIADPKQGKEIFASVRTMADYVAANRTK